MGPPERSIAGTRESATAFARSTYNHRSTGEEPVTKLLVPAPVLVLVLVLALAAPAFAQHGGKISWEKDYKKGLERAKKEGLPLMVYFGADW
jgi:hypothetical protein